MTPQEQHVEVELWAPFTSDTLLEVRSGQMKPLPGTTTVSAIDKSIIDGPVYVGPDGIGDDEHDLVFHGGPDKSILGCKFLTLYLVQGKMLMRTLYSLFLPLWK